ncbi:MAG: DNA methylase [Bellilinea sp.]|nr:MAG: DNA methylase [Bellilinea sp.]
MNPTDRRSIEETFPVKEVSQHAAREKNIRHGHISTLHIWWARRPLAASRATAYAALVPPSQDIMEWQSQHNFIADLSQWENSLNTNLLARARRAIYQAHAQRLSTELGTPVTAEDIEAGRVPPPRVLDPFSGGGSYPLEALRLGCEAYANDYNPVAVLILKATLEYPQKYGRPFEGMPEIPDQIPTDGMGASEEDEEKAFEFSFTNEYSASNEPVNPLLKAVRYWGHWVLKEARRELAPYYRGQKGEKIAGYIWARTLPCQNPVCGVEIPLMRQYWLAKKDKKKISLRPVSHGPGKPIDFEIVAQNLPGYAPWPPGFDPEDGTVARAVVTCPACGAVMDDNTTRRLFRSGKGGQRLVAVVLTPLPQWGRGAGGEGKAYRLPTPEDGEAYRTAVDAVEAKKAELRAKWGMEPVPDEPTPEGKGSGAERAFSVRNYGLNTWGDLFKPRQQLALVTFADAVRRAHAEMLKQGYPEEFARAVATYLGLILNRHSSYNATLCWWEPLGERSFNVFGRQALPMVFDTSEQVPYSTLTGNWKLQVDITCEIIDHLSKIKFSPFLPVSPSPSVTHASATRLPYPDGFFDAILTDPPYYDNVPYSYLSDFFYVWLKRTVGHLYPELFATPLTPKSEEIVAYSNGEGGLEAGMRFFEENLARAFREMQRVLKPGGVAVIVYAHKSTAGWETVINALLDSGLVVTAAWPLNTEMQSRLRASESAALASSIYIVARKAERSSIGFYNEVRAELRRHLDARLQRLWEEGIGGADFFIAAIGSAIEVFGKYEQVMDLEGKMIRGEALLDEVRTLATDFAVRQILHNGFAEEISQRTRLYVLWRWNYGEARVPFDEARKLAQSCGLDLAEEWSKRGSVVRKEQEFIRLLGPHQRDLEHLAAGRELIDVLHHALRLWESGERRALIQRLGESGYGKSEIFYRVAQAVSESMPLDSKEKKLLDGLLTGRARLQEEVGQARLF